MGRRRRLRCADADAPIAVVLASRELVLHLAREGGVHREQRATFRSAVAALGERLGVPIGPGFAPGCPGEVRNLADSGQLVCSRAESLAHVRLTTHFLVALYGRRRTLREFAEQVMSTRPAELGQQPDHQRVPD